jgi:hypothetical protein
VSWKACEKRVAFADRSAVKRLRQQASSVRVKEHSEGCAISPRGVMCEKVPTYWRGLLARLSGNHKISGRRINIRSRG